MSFPTLFPTGMAMPLQSRIVQVHLHEYVLHLMRYCDNRLGGNARFRYYIYNLIMRHQNQQSTLVFMKTKLEEIILTSILALRQFL